MRLSLSISSALLALAAFASTADARMGGMGMSSSMSHGGGHGPMSSMGSPHGFSPDGRTFSPPGLSTRVKGSNWKHPIDSDNGGSDDPPKKTPKGSTQTGGNDTSKEHPGYYGPPDHSHGWTDRYGHYHPGKNSGGGTASNDEPAPASRTPR